MKYLLTILLIIVLIIGGIVATMQFSTFVKNSAIDGCLQAARVQEQKDGFLVTTPENYWYSFCMKEKGYK